VIERPERFVLAPAADSPPGWRETVVWLNDRSAIYPRYPTRVSYCPEVNHPTDGRILQFSEAFVRGTVHIAGRNVACEMFVADGLVDSFLRQDFGFDSDGDGRIDRGLGSPEFTSAHWRPPVFKLGDRYVALEDVDLRRRQVLFRERPASNYVATDWRMGAEIPDFTFVDFGGVTRSLGQFRGKFLLLHFWGTVWERGRPPVVSLDHLKATHDAFGARGLELLGFDYAPMIEEEAVHGRAFVKHHAIDWIQATPQSTESLWEDRFRLGAAEALVLLDPDRRVVWRAGWGHPAQPGDLARILDRLLPRRQG
jgi:hypothetical protein